MSLVWARVLEAEGTGRVEVPKGMALGTGTRYPEQESTTGLTTEDSSAELRSGVRPEGMGISLPEGGQRTSQEWAPNIPSGRGHRGTSCGLEGRGLGTPKGS